MNPKNNVRFSTAFTEPSRNTEVNELHHNGGKRGLLPLITPSGSKIQNCGENVPHVGYYVVAYFSNEPFLAAI